MDPLRSRRVSFPKSRTALAAALVIGVALALSFALLPNRAAAQEPGAPDPVVQALESRLASFFDAIARGDVAQGYADLLSGSPLAKSAHQERRAALVQKTSETLATFGPLHSYERLSARRVGGDLVVMKYLYKCEDFPVVWHVVFYRDLRDGRSGTLSANGDWRVISVRFDTDLEALAR